MNTRPYRPVPLARDVPRSVCAWCRYMRRSCDDEWCAHPGRGIDPVTGDQNQELARDCNASGACQHFAPSLKTRLLRQFGRRSNPCIRSLPVTTS